MEFSIAWNAVCLVCLQEGEMRSIYDKDEKDISISDKIMQCSNIVIQRGMNLPEQICSICAEDLQVAYRFRTNCEASNVILKSFIDSHSITDVEIPSADGQIYKYKPPTGLNVKRIKTTPVLLKIDEEIAEDSVIFDEVDEDDAFIEKDEAIIQEFEEEDANPLSIYKEQEQSEPNNGVFPSYEVCSKKGEEDGCNISKEDRPEDKERELHQKKGRRKNHILRENLEKVITMDNVSSMMNNLTTVTLVPKSRVESKPMKICEICGNTYKYQHALESHMRRHRNEKPFSCEFCDRAFVANVELRRHMRVHTGQKPYACNYCDRRFSDFGSRIKHERTHTGERPYECSTCGKSFAYAHVLSVHILTHTGEKRFKCDQCGRGFTKKVYLKSHMARHDEMPNESNKVSESNERNKAKIKTEKVESSAVNTQEQSVQNQFLIAEIKEEVSCADMESEAFKTKILNNILELK